MNIAAGSGGADGVAAAPEKSELKTKKDILSQK
jgi:hypothetical protein